MKRQAALLGLCASVVGFGATFMLSRHDQREPIFRGRTITDWLTGQDYYANKEQVSEAVVSSGEKAIPALKKLLHSGNGIERLTLQKAPARFWNRSPLKQWR